MIGDGAKLYLAAVLDLFSRFARCDTSNCRMFGLPSSVVPTGRHRVAYNLFMKTTRQLTAIIEREDDAYVALCPELDVASQGDTVESARKNLIEALELFFESADPTEVARRLHGEVFVTRVEVLVG